MSNKEIKLEINNALDHLSDERLQEVLDFLKSLEEEKTIDLMAALPRILQEDHNLLVRLAQ